MFTRDTFRTHILPITDQYAAGVAVSAEREQKDFDLSFCIIFSVK